MKGVAAVAAMTGTMAPADFGNACEELKTANDENRDEVVRTLEAKQKSSGLTDAESGVLQRAKTTGMTFSSAVSGIPEAAGSLSGCSNATARDQIPARMVEGGTGPQKAGLSKPIRMSHDEAHHDAKEAAGVLCEKGYLHWGGGYGGHAEPKIVNHLTNQVGADHMRGGSLLFNIDWRSSRYGRSGMPCSACHAMLCHAMGKCDIQIFLCDKDQKPTQMASEDCDGEDAYSNLCQRVDGGPRPGRK